MQKKYRIAILGLGGVGGFLGARLVAAYNDSTDVEIIFVARGANAQAIKENGLKLVAPEGEIIAQPHIITDGTSPIGVLDLLICCTKAYDLESSIKAVSSSITPATVVLPLLNGVDNTERLQALLPGAKVLQGCIYLVAKLVAPGVVEQRGAFYSLHFGGDKTAATQLQSLFEKANINAVAEDNIPEKIWSKFSFISPVATYTSAYNVSIGQILESEEHSTAIKKLMTEVLALAKQLHINLPDDTIEKNFIVMAKLPYEATSSMQADFVNNKPTELETLTGYVARKAQEQGLQADAYADIYRRLHEVKTGVTA